MTDPPLSFGKQRVTTIAHGSRSGYCRCGSRAKGPLHPAALVPVLAGVVAITGYTAVGRARQLTIPALSSRVRAPARNPEAGSSNHPYGTILFKDLRGYRELAGWAVSALCAKKSRRSGAGKYLEGRPQQRRQ